ncbi:MAG: hypothetical protein IJ961_07625 [Bacteroidales bacterium]|nr:hypothetical protein [Bacteroidales bacterium]
MKKITRKLLLALCAFMFLSNMAISQEQKSFTIDKLSVEGRVDFDYKHGKTSTSGIGGKFFNFEMKGSFLNDFSYRIRQRIDMQGSGSKTDFMILSYHAHKNWSITAGKMPLAVGGWEYDLPPIDVYFASLFWNSFACYEVGAQVEYHSNDKKHDIIFQITNSTFYEKDEDGNDIYFAGKYAYNLIWYGNVGLLKTAYSINMMEQKKGEYINYISLGNDFDFGKMHLVVDFINRGFFNQSDFLFGDFSLIGEVKYAVTDKFTFMAKAGYDRNKHTYLKEVEENGIMIPQPQAYDMTVTPGVEYTFAGLGFEAYPYKGNKNVRLHGFFALNDLNEPTDDMLNPNSSNLEFQFNLGVTWRINFAK